MTWGQCGKIMACERLSHDHRQTAQKSMQNYINCTNPSLRDDTFPPGSMPMSWKRVRGDSVCRRMDTSLPTQ